MNNHFSLYYITQACLCNSFSLKISKLLTLNMNLANILSGGTRAKLLRDWTKRRTQEFSQVHICKPCTSSSTTITDRDADTPIVLNVLPCCQLKFSDPALRADLWDQCSPDVESQRVRTLGATALGLGRFYRKTDG